MRAASSLLLTLLVTLLSPPSLSGQNLTIDEGAFRLSLDGEIVGREEFSIRRAGAGENARVILRGAVELDAPGGHRSLAPALEARGSDLAVTAYQVKASGMEATEVYLTRSDRRFTAKIITSQGEELREFRAGPGSVLLDQQVAHQYYLLSPLLDREGAVSVSILSPRDGRQVRGTLTHVGDEETRVGTELVTASHHRLEVGSETRHIWFDDQGRVLRVEIPARDYVAERESVP